MSGDWIVGARGYLAHVGATSADSGNFDATKKDLHAVTATVGASSAVLAGGVGVFLRVRKE